MSQRPGSTTPRRSPYQFARQHRFPERPAESSGRSRKFASPSGSRPWVVSTSAIGKTPYAWVAAVHRAIQSATLPDTLGIFRLVARIAWLTSSRKDIRDSFESACNSRKMNSTLAIYSAICSTSSYVLLENLAFVFGDFRKSGLQEVETRADRCRARIRRRPTSRVSNAEDSGRDDEASGGTMSIWQMEVRVCRILIAMVFHH